MATPTQIHFSPGQHGLYHNPIERHDGGAAERKLSKLLQANHEIAHIVNEEMLHNHMVHHLLTIYALGASAEELQKAYDDNQYQRPGVPVHRKAQDMEDPEIFKELLGKEDYYRDFLGYFQRKMEKSSWSEVLQEILFKGDAKADDMLARAFAGYFHPLIHMGFGIEFEQPAIIAEGLGEAAIHLPWPATLLVPAEEAAQTVRERKSFMDILSDLGHDEGLRKEGEQDPFGFKSLLNKEGYRNQLVKHVCQYKIDPSHIEIEFATLTQAIAYVSGAAQRPEKAVKIDFLTMHCLNNTLLASSFLNQSWLSIENKVRVVEWIGRLTLGLYVGIGMPQLDLNEIKHYVPMQATGMNDNAWNAIFRHCVTISDDGHIAKMVRALAYGQQICTPLEKEQDFLVKGDMWETIARMDIDSTNMGSLDWDPSKGIWHIFNVSNRRWVRGAGFSQRWENVEDRK